MLFGFHFFGSDNPFYDSFFIDQESSAEGSHIGTSIQLFLSPYTKFFYQLFVRIGYQCKRKIILIDEFLVRLLAVYADTDYFVTGFTQFGIVVAQTACLCRAPRCTVFRLEIQYYLFSFIST